MPRSQFGAERSIIRNCDSAPSTASWVTLMQGVLKKGEPWPTELPKARLRESFTARLLPTTRLTRGIGMSDCLWALRHTSRPRSGFKMLR